MSGSIKKTIFAVIEKGHSMIYDLLAADYVISYHIQYDIIGHVRLYMNTDSEGEVTYTMEMKGDRKSRACTVDISHEQFLTLSSTMGPKMAYTKLTKVLAGSTPGTWEVLFINEESDTAVSPLKMKPYVNGEAAIIFKYDGVPYGTIESISTYHEHGLVNDLGIPDFDLRFRIDPKGKGIYVHSLKNFGSNVGNRLLIACGVRSVPMRTIFL